MYKESCKWIFIDCYRDLFLILFVNLLKSYVINNFNWLINGKSVIGLLELELWMIELKLNFREFSLYNKRI